LPLSLSARMYQTKAQMSTGSRPIVQAFRCANRLF
jgi:hypothetical protein